MTACATERSLQPVNQTLKQELENIVRTKSVRERGGVQAQSTTTWSNDPQVRCIQLPTYPSPDQTSQSQTPLGWHITLAVDGHIKDDRVRQLTQLDALVSAGLLQKTPTELLLKGVQVKAIRYGLTRTGWRVSTTDRTPFCFMYGTPKLLDVSVSEPINVPGQAGIEVYTVTARSGIPDRALDEWAQRGEVQAVFPEIKRMVQGDQSKRQFIKQDNGWVPYECLQLRRMGSAYAQMCDTPLRADTSPGTSLRDAASPSESLSIEKEKFLQEFETTFLKDLDRLPQAKQNQIKQHALQLATDLKALPAPTEEEIKTLIRRDYGWEGGGMDFVGFKTYFSQGYRYKFRVILSLHLPSDRTIDPKLVASRKDLQLLFHQGKACWGDLGFDVKTRKSHSGHGSCSDVVGESTAPIQPLPAGKGMLIPAPASLEEAVAQGLLRAADSKEADAWEQAALKANQKQVDVSPRKHRLFVPERPSTTRGYVVVKDFIYPPNLHGGNSATFFIPKDAPAPIGDRGHSTIYDFNTIQCRGGSCARE